MRQQRALWVRFDAEFLTNPKIQAVRLNGGGADAVMLWVASICYSAQHLTDGWVPGWFPHANGYKPKHVDALVWHGLWHVLQPIPELDAKADGWLINDYLNYQPSKEYMQKMSETRRRNVMKRWQP